LKKSRVLKSS